MDYSTLEEKRNILSDNLLGFTVRLATVVNKTRQVSLYLSIDDLVFTNRHEVIMAVSLLPIRLHSLSKVVLIDHLPTILHDKISRYDVLGRLQSPTLDSSVERFTLSVVCFLELLVLTEISTRTTRVTESMTSQKHTSR